VAEVICTFSGTESGNQFSDPAAETGNRSLGSLAQKRFQFAEGSIGLRSGEYFGR
jgi:hypothetical protein